MSKKLIIAISVGLGIILLILIGVMLFSGGSKNNSSGTGQKFLGFFPFGGSAAPVRPTATSTDTGPAPFSPQQSNYQNKLRKLSSEPVAGAGTYGTKTGTVVRFIEKATGHIYDVEMFSANAARISNTTIPVVYDAVWGSGATSLVTRYLKNDNQTIDTYALTIQNVSTSTDKVVNGVQFPTNILSFDVSGNSVFYLIQSGNGSIGITSDMNGGKKKQVWSSPLRELTGQFVNSSTIALTTKPETDLPGYLYLVNANTGAVKRIIGDVNGLSASVSPDGTLIAALANSTSMFIQKVSDNSRTPMTPATFPEKCVWSRKDKNVLFCAVPNETLDSSSLISWYKGLVSYDDQIWKYDLKTNTSSVIEDISKDTDEPIDAIKPILSDDEQYLVFVNKKDGSLWSLDLTK